MHWQRTGLIPCFAGTGPRPYSLLTYKWLGQSRNMMLSNTKCTDGACPHPRLSRSEPCKKDVSNWNSYADDRDIPEFFRFSALNWSLFLDENLVFCKSENLGGMIGVQSITEDTSPNIHILRCRTSTGANRIKKPDTTMVSGLQLEII